MALRKMIKDRKLSAMIEIDGGVTEKNIDEISIAGADAFVAGSAIFGSQDYKKTIGFLKEKL